MNFSSENLEALFDSDNYIIETAKSISVFDPHRWVEEFGKALTRNIVEAKILHTHNGLTLPIKRYAVSPQKQTLEFAGLYAYNEHSKLLRELLKGLMEHIHNCSVSRLDIALDFKGKIPNRVIKKLCKDRVPFKFHNTTYYKTKKEKKSNVRLDIKIYNKAKKENLNEDMERLEFSFQSQYFKNVCIEDLVKTFQKMEKTIKRFSGLKVKIQSL